MNQPWYFGLVGQVMQTLSDPKCSVCCYGGSPDKLIERIESNSVLSAGAQIETLARDPSITILTIGTPVSLYDWGKAKLERLRAQRNFSVSKSSNDNYHVWYLRFGG